jgi:hypothetical protein
MVGSLSYKQVMLNAHPCHVLRHGVISTVYDDVLELREQVYYSLLKLRKGMKNRFFCKLAI